MIKQALVEELLELERERSHLSEEKALRGKGSKRRGNKALQLIDEMDQKIASVKELIA
jgi:hypothetical protein